MSVNPKILMKLLTPIASMCGAIKSAEHLKPDSNFATWVPSMLEYGEKAGLALDALMEYFMIMMDDAEKGEITNNINDKYLEADLADIFAKDEYWVCDDNGRETFNFILANNDIVKLFHRYASHPRLAISAENRMKNIFEGSGGERGGLHPKHPSPPPPRLIKEGVRILSDKENKEAETVEINKKPH